MIRHNRRGGIDYGAQLLTDALAFWRLAEDTTATRVDATDNNYDLNPSASIAHTTGIFATGANQFVSAQLRNLARSDPTAIFSIASNWEMALWIHPDAITDGGIIARGQGGAGYRGWSLRTENLYPGYIWRLSTDGTAYSDLAATQQGTYVDWHFITCGLDMDNDLQFMYVDAQDKVSVAYSSAVAAPNVTVSIGSQSGTNPWYHGQVEWAGIWERLLTVEERAYLWNGGSGVEL
jgi:hypothetical protein